MSNRRRSSVVPPKDQTRLKIERMEAEREERRRAMMERKKSRAEEEQRNIAAGNPGDVDFIGLVRKWREQNANKALAHDAAVEHPRICICVRKRPISDKERAKNDHDSITCLNPLVWIHSAKLRVDGITKYLDHTSFRFDHAFDEAVSTEDVYTHTTMPLLDFVCSGKGGRATVFAYGQTGSGKTFTMNGIQEYLCEDLFLILSEGEGGCSLSDTKIMLSFFELYGGFIQDLLHNRQRLKVLEDGKGEVVVNGLQEVEATDTATFNEIVERGNNERTTHTTEANDTSSRSHAICQIMLRDKKTGKLRGKLSLVDLAGSERGSDTRSHNAQRRTESAEINTSLLALKECVRALDKNKLGPKHVPYRGSKLTMVLKDCFTSPEAMTTMIATVSPGASAADHSLNTLRYADRIKEQRAEGQGVRKSPMRRKVSPKNGPDPAVKTKVAAVAASKDTAKEKPQRRGEGHGIPKSPGPAVQTKASAVAAPKDAAKEQPQRRGEGHSIPKSPGRGVSRKKALTTASPGKDTKKVVSNKEPTEEELLTPSNDEDPLSEKQIVTPVRDNSGRKQRTQVKDASQIALESDEPVKEKSFATPPPKDNSEREQASLRASPQDEQELRQTVQNIFEQEDAILSKHMRYIQENAELLTEEGKLLRDVQREDVTEEEIEQYISALESVLDRKEDMILDLQDMLAHFSEQLEKEQELSKKVGSLPQF